MALPDGLTEAEAADYLATLARSYEQRTRVEVLTNERDILTTIDAAVIGGQVNCSRVEIDPFDPDKSNQHIEVSRYAESVVLYDPSHAVAIDSGSPADGALYLDRCVRIVVSIRGALRWYDVPVFTGPLTDLDREGALITLEAAGCEAFGQGAAWETGKLPQDTKVGAFRELLYRTGEVDEWMDLPTTTQKLAYPKSIARDTRLWDKAFFIMASLGRLCFYDGYGRLRTPEPSETPVIELAGGDHGLLRAQPEVKHSTDKFANSWWQQGSTSRGKHLEATAVVDEDHPLHPLKVGRNGRGRYLMGTDTNSDLRTKSAAKQAAKDSLALASIDAQVRTECRPVWHLEPTDWAHIDAGDWAMPFPIREFSLPLAGGDMTLGYIDNLPSPNVARIRGA